MDASVAAPDPASVAVVDGLIVDPATPADLRDSGSYAWAVASAWRGDVMLLARTVRAAVLAITRADGAGPECFVEVAVRDDVELFRSAADLKDWLTPRAALRFDAIRIAIRGTETDLDLRIVRFKTPLVTIAHRPGVVLEVGSTAGDGRAMEVLDAVKPSVGRAAFRRSLGRRGVQFNAEPLSGTHPALRDPMLHTRVERRVSRMSVVFLTLLYAMTAALIGLSDLALGTGFFDDWVRSALIIVFVPLPLLVVTDWIVRRPALAAGQHIYALGFPAVELADVTAGRRIVRFGLRLAFTALVASIGVLVNAAWG